MRWFIENKLFHDATISQLMTHRVVMRGYLEFGLTLPFNSTINDLERKSKSGYLEKKIYIPWFYLRKMGVFRHFT